MLTYLLFVVHFNALSIYAKFAVEHFFEGNFVHWWHVKTASFDEFEAFCFNFDLNSWNLIHDFCELAFC